MLTNGPFCCDNCRLEPEVVEAVRLSVETAPPQPFGAPLAPIEAAPPPPPLALASPPRSQPTLIGGMSGLVTEAIQRYHEDGSDSSSQSELITKLQEQVARQQQTIEELNRRQKSRAHLFQDFSNLNERMKTFEVHVVKALQLDDEEMKEEQPFNEV